MATPGVHPGVEFLIDTFLNKRLDLLEKEDNSEFSAEGEVEDIEGEAHDGDVDLENFNQDNRLFLLKFGRDLKLCGEEFNLKYESVTHRSFVADVKKFFSDMLTKADVDQEQFFVRYQQIIENAVKDTGLDEPPKVLGAVLLSIEGLSYLGSSVHDVVCRYIAKKELDKDFKKMASRNELHSSVD